MTQFFHSIFYNANKKIYHNNLKTVVLLSNATVYNVLLRSHLTQKMSRLVMQPKE